jgi:hypothetical protein
MLLNKYNGKINRVKSEGDDIGKYTRGVDHT